MCELSFSYIGIGIEKINYKCPPSPKEYIDITFIKYDSVVFESISFPKNLHG